MWEIRFTKQAQKQFSKLPRQVQRDIATAIDEKLSVNPNIYLSRLSGNKRDLFKFRFGAYRLLCVKRDNELLIIVVTVKHRKDVYRS